MDTTRLNGVRTTACALVVALGLGALAACGDNDPRSLLEHPDNNGSGGESASGGSSGTGGSGGATDGGAGTGGSSGSGGNAGAGGTAGSAGTGGSSGAGGSSGNGGSSGAGGAAGTGGAGGATDGGAGTGGSGGAPPECTSGEIRNCMVDGGLGKQGCQSNGTWGPCIPSSTCVTADPVPCQIGAYGCLGTLQPLPQECTDGNGATLYCSCSNPFDGNKGTWLPGGTDCSKAALCWK